MRIEVIWCVISSDCSLKATPVDTRRKLNVHKTFRRRPGRLLNVSCTFNLRTVSTGTLEFPLWPGFFTEDWLFNLPWAPTTDMFLQSFLNLLRSQLNTFPTKECSVFLLFDFANFFMKLFLLQLKTKNAVKDINQNFMSNKLSEKKSKQLFAKSWFLNICWLNWFLLNFLWEVGAHQSKK